MPSSSKSFDNCVLIALSEVNLLSVFNKDIVACQTNTVVAVDPGLEVK